MADIVKLVWRKFHYGILQIIKISKDLAYAKFSRTPEEALGVLMSAKIYSKFWQTKKRGGPKAANMGEEKIYITNIDILSRVYTSK